MSGEFLRWLGIIGLSTKINTEDRRRDRSLEGGKTIEDDAFKIFIKKMILINKYLSNICKPVLEYIYWSILMILNRIK